MVTMQLLAIVTRSEPIFAAFLTAVKTKQMSGFGSPFLDLYRFIWSADHSWSQCFVFLFFLPKLCWIKSDTVYYRPTSGVTSVNPTLCRTGWTSRTLICDNSMLTLHIPLFPHPLIPPSLCSDLIGCSVPAGSPLTAVVLAHRSAVLAAAVHRGWRWWRWTERGGDEGLSRFYAAQYPVLQTRQGTDTR